MAWIDDNLMVATTLDVFKYTDGIIIAGYPKTYSILVAFGAYQAITTDQWQKTALTDIETRIEACKAYVSALEGVTIDNIVVNIPVYALDAPPEEIGLYLTPASKTISSTSGAFTINAQAVGTTWYIVSVPSWLSVNPRPTQASPTNASMTLAVTPTQNTTGAVRTGEIVFNTDWGGDFPFTVTQESGSGGTSWVLATNDSTPYASPKALLVQVSSNTSWFVESKPAWIDYLNPSPTTGSPITGNKDVTVVTTQNNTGSSRSGVIVFRTTDLSATTEATITQGTEVG